MRTIKKTTEWIQVPFQFPSKDRHWLEKGNPGQSFPGKLGSQSVPQSARIRSFGSGINDFPAASAILEIIANACGNEVGKLMTLLVKMLVKL